MINCQNFGKFIVNFMFCPCFFLRKFLIGKLHYLHLTTVLCYFLVYFQIHLLHMNDQNDSVSRSSWTEEQYAMLRTFEKQQDHGS